MGELKKERINTITGIKILALLAIFVWHCNVLKKPDLGARACEILFICSGFCMAYNYYKTDFQGNIYEAIQFVLKRIKKFYPLYIITMLISMFYLVCYKGYILNGALMTTGIFNILLIQSWCTGTFNGAAWFLSALMFCYFCTPFILSILRECNRKKKIYLFIAVLFIRLALEYIRISYPSIISFSLHSYPLVRMLEYFLACIMGSFFIDMKEKLDEYLTIKSKNKYTILFNILEVLGLVSYISAVILFDNIWYRGLFVLIGLILISIYAFQKGIISKILSNKFFTKVSKYEMEFFLWHQVIINFFNANRI